MFVHVYVRPCHEVHVFDGGIRPQVLAFFHVIMWLWLASLLISSNIGHIWFFLHPISLESTMFVVVGGCL